MCVCVCGWVGGKGGGERERVDWVSAFLYISRWNMIAVDEVPCVCEREREWVCM